MLEAIKILGEINLKRKNKNTNDINDIFSILIEDSNYDGNYPKVLVAVFYKENDRFVYNRIDIEDNDKEKVEKYLYCRGASKGSDYTPTTKVTEIEKNFKNKIESWFKKYEKYDKFIKKLALAVEESKDKMIRDLSNKLENIAKPSSNKKQGCIFTLAIEENGEKKYIGDYQIFKDLLIESIKDDYKKIMQVNHICSVCGEVESEIYGNAIPFAFYTIDKPGYIAGGFYEKDAWKNAPICLECILKIKEGKKILDEKFKSKMGGQQYYLIPKFILGVKGSEVIIDTFFNYFEHRDDLLTQGTLEHISEDEKEILEELGKLNDVLTYNFLFFRADNPQVFKINLLVEDILPSRISSIFEAKKKAENKEIFKGVKVKKNKYEDIKFRFDILKHFITSTKTFFEIIDKTFRGITIDKNLLFSLFLNRIQQSFISDTYLKPLVLQAFVSFLFFKELGILTKNEVLKNGGEIMSELKGSELKEKAEGFFKDFSDTFYTPAHKAVFLLGVLAQKLLNIQFNERGSTPFRKNLKGLKMNEEDFKNLLTRIQNKLEEYKKNYYHSLERLISEYFIEAGKNWSLSTDELNFYFVLGMNLEDFMDNILNLENKEVKDERNN
jgi:CRISPR-associated protein Csh1